MERLFDEPEAAMALRISRHTLRSWRKQRRIGFVRLAGHTIRFPESEIARIIGEGFQAAQKPRVTRKHSAEKRR
jgi:excisionase family DNA binding protein